MSKTNKKNIKKRINIINKNIFLSKKKAFFENNTIYYKNLEFSINEYANLTHIDVSKILSYFYNKGLVINKNHEISEEQLFDLCDHFKINLIEKPNINPINLLEDYQIKHKSEFLQKRPPIITIMGHVDHGKTTLLDVFRKSNVAEKEVGNITQHIGAYQITYKDQKLTFIDTPGHEAFTEIRSRGAKVTDIVILIISAVDGIKPQTIESIKHAQNANVKIIVAINKIDLPNANPKKIENKLTEFNLISIKNGGNNEIIEISAKQRLNLDKLLDKIIEIANNLNLKSSYEHFPIGTVIESGFDSFLGRTGSLIIKDGVLMVGDNILIGTEIFKIKFLEDENKKRIKIAYPSQPVRIYGLKNKIFVGQQFIGSDDLKLCKEIINEREIFKKHEIAKKVIGINNVKNYFQKNNDEDINELKIIIISDTQGSLDALLSIIEKIKFDNVKINVIYSNIGQINKADILLAMANSAIIYSFNAKINSQAKILLKDNNVKIKYFNIIYSLVEELEEFIMTKADPSLSYETIGNVLVKKVFEINKKGKIAGCLIVDGKITNKSYLKVMRGSKLIHEGQISSLKHYKEKASEVLKGRECGINIAGFDNFLENDTIIIQLPKK